MNEQQKATAIKIITFTAVLLVLIMVASLIINLVSVARLTNRRDELKGELADLMTLSAELDAEIAYKGSDEYIEKYARLYLGYIDPDEEVFK